MQSIEIPYDVSRMLMSEAMAHPACVDFTRRAEQCGDLIALRALVDAGINERRYNEQKTPIGVSVFSLLSIDFDRHAKNRTEARKLGTLRTKARQALGVPADCSPWLVVANSLIYSPAAESDDE